MKVNNKAYYEPKCGRVGKNDRSEKRENVAAGSGENTRTPEAPSTSIFCSFSDLFFSVRFMSLGRFLPPLERRKPLTYYSNFPVIKLSLRPDGGVGSSFGKRIGLLELSKTKFLKVAFFHGT